MVGKLTAVLIRKEAEAYRSQGLHEEAFALYDELLASSPNLDEALRSDIQSKMDLIVEEMEALSNPKDERSLSSKEMMQLKVGWEDTEASVEDLLISAQGLCQIGAHRDALMEFAKLLESGVSPEKVTDSAIESFISLFEAKRLPLAAEKWLRGIYPEAKKILAVHLLFIRELSRHSDKNYALQYCRFVRSRPSLPAGLIKRLDAAQAKYQIAIKEGKQRRPESTASVKAETVAKPNVHKPPSRKSSGEDGISSEIIGDSSLSAPFSISGPMDKKKSSLKDLLGVGPDDSFDEEVEVPTKKKGKNQLHFIKIILLGWFDRISKSLSAQIAKIASAGKPNRNKMKKRVR